MHGAEMRNRRLQKEHGLRGNYSARAIEKWASATV